MPQIYAAAYLGYEPAELALAHHMYDQTGEFNDHITGICPCGWCRWEESPTRWIDGLLGWGQNLPFAGIDERNAEQELAIRVGRGLAEAIWRKLDGMHQMADEPHGAYVIADMRAERFLRERTPAAREPCREWWTQAENNGLPDWAHQVLYHIVDFRHRRENVRHWFLATGRVLDWCDRCDVHETWSGRCRHQPVTRIEGLQRARDITRDALVPWVLSKPSATMA